MNSVDLPSGLPAQITVVQSTKGKLNKRINLNVDGSIIKDHPLPMSEGWAHLVPAGTAAELATTLSAVQNTDVYALVLGTLKNLNSYALPVLSRRAAAVTSNPSVTRTRSNFHYEEQRNRWVLIDADDKDMPPEVAERISWHGGWEQAVNNLWPEAAKAATVTTPSSSSHITKPDGTPLGSGSAHKYVLADAEVDPITLLEDLRLRGWLSGLSWWVVGNAGQLLERCVVDAAVGTPERLCFEAAPALGGGLTRSVPAPISVEGDAAGPPVTMNPDKRSEAFSIRAAAKDALREQAEQRRQEWREARARLLSETTGITFDAALATVKGLFGRVAQLIGDYQISLSDETITTPNEILEKPHNFHLLDGPSILEGWEYGRSRITIHTLRDDGQTPLAKPYIVDHAHGLHTRYYLIPTNDPNAPSVRLDRSYMAKMNPLVNRAVTHEDQMKRVNYRRTYLHDELWRFWFECENYHRARKQKPSPPRPPMTPFKSPDDTNDDLAGRPCDCLADRHDTNVKEWEEYEANRVAARPTKWFADQTGIGKSEARSNFVIKLTEGSRFDRKRQGAICIVVERHDHIDGTEEEPGVLPNLKENNVSCAALRGRVHFCQFPEEIAAYGGVSDAVERDVCSNCPLYDECGYYKQADRAKESDVVVMPREIALGNPQHFVGRRVAVWLCDEDMSDAFFGDTLHITKDDLTVAPMNIFVSEDVRKVLATVASAVQWSNTGSPVHTANLEQAALLDAIEDIENTKPSLKLEPIPDKESFKASMRRKFASVAHAHHWADRVSALLRVMLTATSTVPGATIMHVDPPFQKIDGVLTKPPAYDYIALTRVKEGVVGVEKSKGPRVLFSATADVWVNERTLDFGEPDRDGIAFPGYVKVRLIDSHSGSANSLVSNDTPTSLALRLVRHLIVSTPANSKPLFIAQKAVVKAVNEHLPETCCKMHFGATTSRNDAEGAAYALIAGRPLPWPHVLESKVEALKGTSVTRLPAGEFYPRGEVFVDCGPHHSLASEGHYHPDPLVNHYLGYYLKTHITQAAGRPRPLTASGPMIIDIFGQVPSGFATDEIGSLHDFECGPERLICRTGLVPLSPKAINALAPALYPDLYRDRAQVQETRRYEMQKQRAITEAFEIQSLSGAKQTITLNAPSHQGRPEYEREYNVKIEGLQRGMGVGFPVGMTKKQAEIYMQSLIPGAKLQRRH